MSERSAKHVATMLGEPRKAVLAMFVPVLIALLIGQINTFTDTVWCSFLGIDALSAIATVSPFYYVLIGIGNGIGIGANVAISRRIGSGDREGASRCASQTVMIMLLVSLPLVPILFLLSGDILDAMGAGGNLSESNAYFQPIILLCPFIILNGVISGTLRGEGSARLSTLINGIGAISNMVLDPILIFGMDLGIAGASMATVFSAVISVGLGIAIYRSDMTFLRPHVCRPERAILYDVFYVGIPQMSELVVMGLMNIVLVKLVIICGGTDGLAVYATPWSLISIAMVPVHALAAAMVPVCSSSIGQNDRQRLSDAFRFTVTATVAIGFLMMAVILLAAGPVMWLFSTSSDMSVHHDEMVHVVRIYSLFLPCYGLIFVGSSMLSALRRSGIALASSFLRNLMLITMYFVSSFHSMEWIYWSLTLGEIIGGLFMIALALWQFRLRFRKMGGNVVPI